MIDDISETVPRIESIKVKNYRVLRDFELTSITPLTVLLGPNGSGKSTVFDVFAFLSECFTVGLRKAWDKRNRFRELRSRDSNGPIEFELKYREQPNTPIITYQLSIDETLHGPVVSRERLQWKRQSYGAPYRFLDFENGRGNVTSGETPDTPAERVEETLSAPDVLAVNTLGQLARNPRVNALRQFITGWHLSYLSADNTRGIPESGSQERLSETGDNLPNVIQYLKEQHPDRLSAILKLLSRRVPKLERVDAEIMPDGRLLLQIKDAPFDRPIMSKFASDGTLKMLAYLTLLYDPEPPRLIGIEEPENQLHPKLLRGLAEECRTASSRTQLMVTTHSPFYVNGLRPSELWILYRDDDGYTRAARASELDGITDLIRNGALLGDLWMEGFFGIGDPLTNSGGPKRRRTV
ncbi:MAG: AAA family ATPase [Chloroflexi bacterium]|nr:AAA family ATPase [Chloroflexota bacterium]